MRRYWVSWDLGTICVGYGKTYYDVIAEFLDPDFFGVSTVSFGMDPVTDEWTRDLQAEWFILQSSGKSQSGSIIYSRILPCLVLGWIIKS